MLDLETIVAPVNPPLVPLKAHARQVAEVPRLPGVSCLSDTIQQGDLEHCLLSMLRSNRPQVQSQNRVLAVTVNRHGDRMQAVPAGEWEAGGICAKLPSCPGSQQHLIWQIRSDGSVQTACTERV